MSSKKQQLLEALVRLLEKPKAEKITTALLATQLNVSEAALYRQFASKAQMYDALIEFIETSVFTYINELSKKQNNALIQIQLTALMVLSFAKKNPGLARVMVGDVLVYEKERLQARMNQFFARLELSFKSTLKLAILDELMTEERAVKVLSLLMNFLMGRIFWFVKTQFEKDPTVDARELIASLLIQNI